MSMLLMARAGTGHGLSFQQRLNHALHILHTCDQVSLCAQVGDNIFIIEERVRRLAERLKKWVHLRRTPPKVGC